MKILKHSLLIAIFLLGTFSFVPQIAISSSVNSDSKDAVIIMLLEKIKSLEAELAQIKSKKSKPLKVEVTTQNSDYKKEATPLFEVLEDKTEIREKQMLRLAESMCKKPMRSNVGGKTKFTCSDRDFFLNTNLNVKSLKATSAKQRIMIDDVKVSDLEIEKINKKIEGLKSRYGISQTIVNNVQTDED